MAGLAPLAAMGAGMAGGGGGLSSLGAMGILTGGLLGSEALSSSGQNAAYPGPKKWELGVAGLNALFQLLQHLEAKRANEQRRGLVEGSFARSEGRINDVYGRLLNDWQTQYRPQLTSQMGGNAATGSAPLRPVGMRKRR